MAPPWRIVSIGEILFDIYPDGRTLGGAPFNFLYHIRQLTGGGWFASRIGRDEPGDAILEFLRRSDMAADLIQIDERHPTGTARVALSDDKIPHFTLTEPAAYDFLEATPELIARIDRDTDLLYFGTLAQRNAASRSAIRALWNRPIRYFLDVNLRQQFYNAETLSASLRQAHVVKLNADELKIVNDLLPVEPFNIKVSARRLVREFDIELLCVTLGSEGALIDDGHAQSLDREPVITLVDTVGAGDAYAAVLCLGYLHRWDIQVINRWASRFAAEVCAVPGALPPDSSYPSYREAFHG